MNQLIQGMMLIGKNNLQYRLPQSKKNDEFAFVSNKFNDMCCQLEEEINNTYLSKIRQQEAEFYAMQTSINPHFLYNAFEVFRQRLHAHGDPKMEQMLLLLSRLFQYQTHGSNYVMLGEELEILQTYLDFFTLWYEERFSCNIQVPDELLACGIPKYTLQPIMENFFLHGLRPGNDNQITLKAVKEKHDVILEFSDNGAGIEPKQLQELKDRLSYKTDLSGHLGLINVHERIMITFGPKYGLTINSPGRNQGTTIQVLMREESLSSLKNHSSCFPDSISAEQRKEISKKQL